MEDIISRGKKAPEAAVYFTGPNCGLCNVLKPKLVQLFAERFPAIAVAEVDCELYASVSSQQGVFAVPTLIIYFEGRKARVFSLVEAELSRPQSVLT